MQPLRRFGGHSPMLAPQDRAEVVVEAQRLRGRAIVAGAGIGGLCAASGLRRLGYEVDVLERAGGLGSVQVGGGIHLWNNATLALRRLGLITPVEAAGKVVERFSWYTHTGALLGSGDVGAIAHRVGTPALGLTRSVLHDALTPSLEGITVHLGAECVGFEQDDAGVTVRVADGSERRADLLVGADGLRSAVRAQLVGDGEPKRSGIAVWQGVARLDASPAEYGMLWGRGVRMGFYPVTDGTFWYLLSPVGEGPAVPPKVKARALALVAGWAEPAAAMVEATPEEAIVGGEILCRDPVARWGEGRVTLLGDAAHAMTPFMGQGAGQAMEDAAVLVSCLRAGTSVSDTLRRYELLRQPRTRELTERSWKLGRTTGIRNPIACAVRDRLLRRMFPRVIWPEFERTVGYAF
jgi:2-polyprenyl-6-methoxyphenol hydroxylase-like FAD-dependent oxidoreductase